MSLERLHYVDWLRVGAFALLIAYHSSAAFFPHFRWLLTSPETSAGLELAMSFPRAWRLALLFFVSGVGVYFAARRQPLQTFIGGRFIRLGLPLAFAMAVVCVPQVWAERVVEQGYQGSLLEFWLTRYFTEGAYPTGNLTWAHMWFVAYLIGFVALGLPVLRLLDHPRLKGVSDAIRRVAASPFAYLAFLLPVAANLTLSPWFPRQTNALYNDWAFVVVWASWFAFGYLFARDHAVLVAAAIRRRWLSAALAAGTTAALAALFWLPVMAEPAGVPAPPPGATERVLDFALAWFMILALVGFAARHLDRRSAIVSYLNAGIFSFYIAHQTVVVLALAALLPLGLPMWPAYGLTVAITVAGSMLFYEVARRIPGPLGAAMGARVASSAKRAAPALPGAPPAGRGV